MLRSPIGDGDQAMLVTTAQASIQAMAQRRHGGVDPSAGSPRSTAMKIGAIITVVYW